MTRGLVPVAALPGPFSTRRVDLQAAEGQTLDVIVASAIPDPVLRGFARVWLVSADGQESEVPERLWPRVRPRAGVLVLVRVVPRGGGQGGGGKNVLRLVLAIAVVVAASVLAVPLGSAISSAAGGAIGTATATSLAGTVLTTVGMLALNALIPPPKPNLSALSASRLSLTLTSTANQANPFGPVPRVYGRMRVFPLLAARTISEAEGEDQYLRALFDFGQGPLQISQIRIGTVPIEQFDGVEMELREGRPGDPPITLYPRTVREDGYAMRLRANAPQVVETRDDAREALIDLTFLGLVRFGANSQRLERTVRIRIEHRPAGTSTWTLHAERDFAAASEQRLTRGERILFDPPGRREIRVTRLTADTQDTAIRDDTFLTAVRSVQGAPPVRATSRCLLALRIKASDQLSGTLDQVNALAEAVLPVWTGTAWVEQVTRSPAWAYLDVLRGAANRRPIADARIDLAEFVDWAAECAAAPASGTGPRREFNGVFDSQTTVFEALRDIAAAGRGAFGMREGKFSIVRDRPQTVPIQHFTPRNSRGFTGRRVFRRAPHAIAARYIEPEREWSQQEVMVYADGYNEANATRIENIEFFGVTNRDQAWRETRYAMAVAQLRPDTYELTADIEHLLVTRGDLVRVTHDVPAFGVSAGRIVATESDGAGAIVGVTLDEAVGVPANAGLALRIRTAAGQSIVTPASAPPGERTAFAVPAIAGDRTAAAARNLMSNQDMAGLVAGSPGTPPDGWSVGSSIGGLVRTLSGPIIEDGIVAFDVRFAGTWTAGGTRGINTPAVSAAAGQRIAHSVFVRRMAGSLAGITTRAQVNTRTGGTFVGVIGDVVIAPTEAPLRQQQTQINTQFPTSGVDNWRGNVQLTFPAGIPVDVTLRVGFPQGEHVTLATDQVTPFTPAVAPGDLALVGEAGRESVELLVKEIRPGPDMSATLVLVDAAPAVHQAETAPIPPWDPQATLLPPPPTTPPPAPTITELFSDSRALLRGGDGTVLARIGATVRADGGAQLRWRRAAAGEPWQQGAAQPDRAGEALLFTTPLTEGDTYEVAARAVTAAGLAGEWSAAVSHVVAGKTAPPSDVTTFTISGRRLDWSHVSDLDLAGYRIRWCRGSVVDWGRMTPAHGGLLTSSPFVLDDLPAGPVTIAIKAVDDGGRESLAPAAIHTDLGDAPARFGVAEQDMHADAFGGSRFGAVLDAGDLVSQTSSALPMWGDEAALMWTSDTALMWASVIWPALAYEEDLDFLTPPGSGRVLVDLRADGAGARVLWRAIAKMWTSDTAAMWTADTALMWPAQATADWVPLAAPIPASALPAAIRVEIDGGPTRPRVTALVARLDAEPVTELLADVALAAGGTRLPIVRSYTQIAAVVATLQGGTGARTLKVIDKDEALGPLLQAFDAAGAGIAATIDATIHGY